MPISLKCKLKKLNHNGSLTDEEYEDLLKKLDGHDRQIREEVIEEFVELINTMPTYENEYGEIMPMPVEMIAEQLKEK